MYTIFYPKLLMDNVLKVGRGINNFAYQPVKLLSCRNRV